MSGQATINVVDDEDMSSQGSVNAPVAPQQPSVQQGPTAMQPTEVVGTPVQWHPTMTQQSGVAGRSGSPAPTVPVQSTQVVAAPTVPVDAPSRAETKQAFDEVSSVLRTVSSEHAEVRSEMQGLASEMESLRQARAGDVETTAQVQATLQRTLSASSSLEARMGYTEEQQARARAAYEEARRASEQALSQAAMLRAEQERTTTQISEVLASRADETQRQLEGTTQVAMATQQKVQEMASKIAEQKELTFLQANLAREAQAQLEEELTRKTKKELQNVSAIAQQAQTIAQQSAQTYGSYEKQLAELKEQMTCLEGLLVQQRKKSMTLESQLSAAQDRIGGAERRAKVLEDENVRIKGELQNWSEYYEQEQETGVDMPMSSPITFDAPTRMNANPASTPSLPIATALMPIPEMVVQQSGPVPAGSSHMNMDSNPIPPLGEWPPLSWDAPLAERPTEERRVSFGSVFPGSSGTGGNGGRDGGSMGISHSQVQGRSTTFNIGIKPKDPPYFHGRTNEDVDTWIAKVGDFLYLTEANSRQQVAYAATLLQEAAADWWATLLRERSRSRPGDWAEFTVLLAKRFGSSTRVDRARAELRNIRQGQSESVRSYSTRFEALLGKLPTFDREWAKIQFVWGLNQRVAELVTIAEPSDLHAAINKAEKIEMARSFAASGQPVHKNVNLNRGRGGFYRGRGRFGAVHVTNQGQSNNAVESSQLAVQQQHQQQYYNPGYKPLGRN